MPLIKTLLNISFGRALVVDKLTACHNLVAKMADYELSEEEEWDMCVISIWSLNCPNLEELKIFSILAS